MRDRLSRLSEVSLRISESLDLNTVLNEVAASACALTGARCNGITTMDGSGQPQDFVTSGLAPEEHQRFLDMPHGLELYEYLREAPQPLRLRDLAAHLSSLGFPDDSTLARTFLGVPICHQGVHVGNFYLADKELRQEFTSEDEEVLVMFASQAGAAIANARKHRDEQRARADLEALIDTSPVGVVVFDARTGEVVSLIGRRNALWGDLRTPGCSVEQLLDALTFRRADGREVSLAENPPGASAARGHDGTRRGDCHPGPRRSEHHHADQCHAHPLGGRRDRVGGRHPAGYDTAGGVGTDAGRVPGVGNAGSTFSGAQVSMVAIHGRIHKYFTVIALRITPMSHKIM